MNQIELSLGLSKDKIAQIHELERICAEKEPLCMKLNWDMLETRPQNENNDLLFYKDNQLVGFLGLYAFGPHPEEIELTGMVHPDYRRRGIFKNLFEKAAVECKKREAKKMLLITERRTESGTSFSKANGQYDFSEFRMICNQNKTPKSFNSEIQFRSAAESDREILQKIDKICFDSDSFEREINETFVALLNGKVVGKIGIEDNGGLKYVFGVGVLPEYRSHGVGRTMLSSLLKMHFSQGKEAVILEVATYNDNALSLYTSCGFRQVTVYDYYVKML